MRAAQTFQNKPFETGVSPTATLSYWVNQNIKRMYNHDAMSQPSCIPPPVEPSIVYLSLEFDDTP